MSKMSLSPTFPQGTVQIIGNQGVPMIVVGSGSMANNGALTLTTALAANPAITSCYVYLPAGAIAAGIPAAATWYYAVFSSVTAATVYNNIYSSGTPIIPASPTALATTGPGAYTGVSTAVTAYQMTVAGNLIGLNGGLRVSAAFSYTNSGANKTQAITYGSFTLLSVVNTSSVTIAGIWGFKNAGATNSQFLFTNNAGGAFGAATGGTINSAAIDTTSSQTLATSLTNATPASNNLLLANSTVELIPSVS